ncbi:F-box associated domain containing protein [Tanacetum coccineum]
MAPPLPTTALEDDHRPKKIATPVSYLQSEIIHDILSRLPVKSLLRFKSVCKLWHSLILDPCFIKSHLSLSTCNINFTHHRLINNSIGDRYLSSCPLNKVLCERFVNELDPCFPLELTRKPNLRVIGSCNGLLSLLDLQTLFIYNPSTRLWSELYKAPFGLLYGFGYDESTDDYKVVVITGGKQVVIFSLKTGTWKKIGNFPYDNLLYHSVRGCRFHECGKFSNGALHWACSNQGFGSLNSLTIVSLDLAKETYGEVLQPVYDKGQNDLTLGALGHCLCITCSYLYDRVDLWVMKVYGVKDSWTKLASLPYLHEYGMFHQLVAPLCISNDGKVILQYRSKLVVYDTHNSSSTKICRKFDGLNEICIFVESLVSPCAPVMPTN